MSLQVFEESWQPPSVLSCDDEGEVPRPQSNRRWLHFDDISDDRLWAEVREVTAPDVAPMLAGSWRRRAYVEPVDDGEFG